MTLRSVVLVLLCAFAAVFLILNWAGITALVPVNLIVTETQAPLGLILLIVLGTLWVVGIVWALMQQASTLVEIRKAYKEANTNKSLADHAELSRLEQAKESLRQEMTKLQEAILKSVREMAAAPQKAAEEGARRTSALEASVEKLTRRVEMLAEKAGIDDVPVESAEMPKKGFFGFLSAKEKLVEVVEVPAQQPALEAPAPAAEAENPAQLAPAEGEAKKDGFFKKMFHS